MTAPTIVDRAFVNVYKDRRQKALYLSDKIICTQCTSEKNRCRADQVINRNGKMLVVEEKYLGEDKDGNQRQQTQRTYGFEFVSCWWEVSAVSTSEPTLRPVKEKRSQ